MVWKKMLKILALTLIDVGFNFIFNAMDKDKDGKLSREEISAFVKLINKKIANLRKK